MTRNCIFAASKVLLIYRTLSSEHSGEEQNCLESFNQVFSTHKTGRQRNVNDDILSSHSGEYEDGLLNVSRFCKKLRLTLLRYCEYVDETPLVSTPMIFPLVSSLVVNCSNGTPDCFSFWGIRRATHMRHGPTSADSEVTSPPSAFSLGYGNNVDEIWKTKSLSSFS